MAKQTMLEQFGPWAVVTGASSGIGMEFARQLAGHGLNLVLVARREQALKELAVELEGRHQIATRTVPLDLSNPGFLDELRKATDDLEVSLVISNAGAARMGAFLRVPVDELLWATRLNVEAHIKLAHHFGSLMLDQKRQGGLLLVSSTIAFAGMPFAGNYSGAKAYLLNLGQAMNYELEGTGINVSVLVPGPTSTAAFDERKDIDLTQLPGGKPMKVKPVVVGALKALARNEPYYVPGVMNRIIDTIGRRVLTRRANRNIFGALLKRAAPDELKI